MTITTPTRTRIGDSATGTSTNRATAPAGAGEPTPGRAQAGTTPGPAWIAHAGGAISRPGGAPTLATLAECVALGSDWIELDVCATADGELVLRHDLTLPSGRPVSSLTLTELRHLEPAILTLDEARHLTGRWTPLLIDIKTELAVPPLARQLARLSEPEVAVCTENVSWLLEMRDRAPRVARWLSLPDMGTGSYQGVRSLVSSLVRRRHLPLQIQGLAAEVGAAALSLHHWVVTAGACEAAHADGLPVAAWTVNRPDSAQRLVDCGVDFITSDRVDGMRATLQRRAVPAL